MATTHSSEQQSGLVDRMFLDHPRSLGMSWARHGIGAVAIGGVYLAMRPTLTHTGSSAVRASFAQLTEQPGAELYPSLSPDGKWVVYTGEATGNHDIYLQSVSGTNAVNLTADKKMFRCPCHDSEFTLAGKPENAIPPRGMDTLEVEPKPRELQTERPGFAQVRI